MQVSAGLSRQGGGSAHLGRLCATATAEYCRQRGLGFRVLHLGAGEAGLLEGVPVRHFDGRRRGLARAVLAVQRARRRPALVFDHLGPARVEALLPAGRRAPYLLWLLGIEAWRPLSWDRRRALSGAAIRLAISAHTRERVGRVAPRAGEIEVLHPVLSDGAAEGEIDRDLLERLGQGYLLIVGRMAAAERYKGHDELLAALPRLAACGAPARLVIVGGGDDRPRLEGRAAALGIADRVAFTGHVAEATRDEIYRRAAMFVMPSRDEGFGLVYLEAMRAGRPCVAAQGSAAAEIVADGETGLLVPAGEVEPLARALAGLLADPGRAAEMGRRGEQRWRERFSGAAFRERLDRQLDRLVAGGSP